VHSVEWAGEELLLLTDRALVWPARSTLVVADTHFGKASLFRRRGVPVPAGTTARDLARLDALIAAHGCRRLVVLGDFFHAVPEPGEPFLAELRVWRATHAAVDVVVVAGNHDRPAGRARLPEVEWLAEPLVDGPFVWAHEPGGDARGYVVGGHVHPVVRLGGRGPDRLRLPVFWQRSGHAVLPSFGSFTGGHPVRAEAGDRLYAVGPDAVLPLPAPKRRVRA
jgi:DNA ligase-associated metallophosphoesterase